MCDPDKTVVAVRVEKNRGQYPGFRTKKLFFNLTVLQIPGMQTLLAVVEDKLKKENFGRGDYRIDVIIDKAAARMTIVIDSDSKVREDIVWLLREALRKIGWLKDLNAPNGATLIYLKFNGSSRDNVINALAEVFFFPPLFSDYLHGLISGRELIIALAADEPHRFCDETTN